VLITQADLLERHRYVFLTDTLDKLNELGTIPIVNENDVVTGGSKGPQVFSDNDNLSAILASGSDADGLALLTDVEAVFTKPPDEPGAERIKVWGQGSQVILGEKSGMGRGGMGSKISAALVASDGGVTTCVASGYDLANIKKVFSGDDVGTLFPGRSRPNKRQRWLNLATGSAGTISVSHTFHEMMLGGQDQSLRLTDVIAVQGSFPAQAVVSLLDPSGVEFARGIIQKRSAEIKNNLPDTAEASSFASFTATHEVMRATDLILLA